MSISRVFAHDNTDLAYDKDIGNDNEEIIIIESEKDFNNMINHAIHAVREDNSIYNSKYIIIDEYQYIACFIFLPGQVIIL